ncbi:hypothetical protein [Mesorhizobium sp. M1403]|uniref:hypothetical protein n=1 Tax=Mesorhizobium sp. M1403 TaxID=2957097 RepID=UPI003339E672
MLGIYDPTERQRVIVGGLDGGIMSGDFRLQAREECRNLGVEVDRFSHRGGEILATPPIISDLIQICL